MRIKLEYMYLENFKGVRNLELNFSDQTKIRGANATGKTTIFDAFTWLLFNKNSAGSEKFNLRPLDKGGNGIDNVEIKVVALLNVDGKEVELSKVQKQNWVKKRGTDVTTLQGNINSFEIDGYPKSEADFKAYIASLIPEETFKILTNPAYFPGLEWKKQRNILMKLSSTFSDVDFAKTDVKYMPLLDELEKAPSTDDIRKKYTKALSEWKKTQDELPARIDEVSRQFVDVDVAELELHRNQLKEEIAATEKSMDDTVKLYEEYQKKSDAVFELRKAVLEYRQKANCNNMDQRALVQKKIDACNQAINKAVGCIELANMHMDRLNRQIATGEDQRRALLVQYNDIKDRAYPEYEPLTPLDENSLICPTCGQVLPDEVRAQKMADYADRCSEHEKAHEDGKADFEKKQKESLERIVASGKSKRDEIVSWKDEVERKQQEIAGHKATAENARKELADLEKILSEIPREADLSTDQVFEEMQMRLAKMEETLNGMDSGADARSQAKIRLSGMREMLADVEQKIAKADNSAVEERIEELKEEQSLVAQKVADQEQMIYLLEEFIRAKMKRISENINGKFNTVSWKLFDMQLNGGMKECCECTVNGVPYSTLNNGHRIVAGLDIISSLSEVYDASCPIFVDNAESLNEFNVPDMDAQLILLTVSEDRQLKVEGV